MPPEKAFLGLQAFLFEFEYQLPLYSLPLKQVPDDVSGHVWPHIYKLELNPAHQ